jgi:hypothetical protein
MAMQGFTNIPPEQRPLLVWNGQPVRALALEWNADIEDGPHSSYAVRYRVAEKTWAYIDLFGRRHSLVGDMIASRRRSGRRLLEVSGMAVQKRP